MWKRTVFSHLKKTLICSSSPSPSPSKSLSLFSKSSCLAPPLTASSFRPSLLPRTFSVDAGVSNPNPNLTSKPKVEEVMPIATGHEREELEAELEGRDILAINHPVGPFGTKEAPAIVQSYYDRRIVGCPGGEEEDEHDVVWFWLEKDKPVECPVCTQYFKLEVVGPGGDPEGHDHDEGEHHH